LAGSGGQKLVGGLATLLGANRVASQVHFFLLASKTAVVNTNLYCCTTAVCQTNATHMCTCWCGDSLLSIPSRGGSRCSSSGPTCREKQSRPPCEAGEPRRRRAFFQKCVVL